MKKSLSCTLMISNLLCTILVVAAHYNSKWLINIDSYSKLNFYFQEFISNGIARSAVPLFALISGFFFFREQKLHNITYLIFKKTKTILIPYTISGFMILLYYDIQKFIVKGNFVYLNDINSFLYNIFVHPISLQFWYLRDLIFLVILSPIIFLFNNRMKLIVLTFSFVFWICNIQFFPIFCGWYFINSEVFFFFLLGGIFLSSNKFEKILNIKTKDAFCIFLLWITFIYLRIWIDPYLDVWYIKKYTVKSLLLYKISILLGVVSIIKIASFLIDYKWLVKISGLTFFVYLFHLNPLSSILYENTNFGEYSFYFLFPMATVISFLTGYLMYKFIPSLYNLLTGARSPKKSMCRTSSD
ncbi:MAG: hypothetical protein CSA33_00285 [Desulfobulbus propionicus]|nr:MAG: hypothetical protein CSA33_00285 [Desulfobulbus propionicus]